MKAPEDKREAAHRAARRADKVGAAKPALMKKAKLQALLARPKGATLAQPGNILGWQPFTVRREEIAASAVRLGPIPRQDGARMGDDA